MRRSSPGPRALRLRSARLGATGWGVLLAVLLASCAAPLALDRPGADAGGASGRELAVAGFRAWVVRGDAATGVRRFDEALAKDGADPWVRYGAALAARRGLDDAGEVAHLVALVRGAPGHPLAPVAARRLGELAEVAPPLAQAVEAGLASALAGGRLAGLPALRARAARVAAAVSRGDLEGAARLRAEGGAFTAWTLAGPYGALHALELDTAYPPEAGDLAAPAPGGCVARAIPVLDGVLSLDGEGPRGDIFYAGADVTLARGGAYLLAAGATSSLRLFVDGAPALERRASAGFPPTSQVVPLSLAAGTHRVLAKLARGAGRAALAVTLARADGAPSDATASAAVLAGGAAQASLGSAPASFDSAPPALRSGCAGLGCSDSGCTGLGCSDSGCTGSGCSGSGRTEAPGRAAPVPTPVSLARDLARALEREVPPEVARLVAARDALEGDREAAKELVEEALVRAPASPPLLALRAEARRDDPTLAVRVGRARAEADEDRALAADPGDAATRLRRAELLRADERPDDAAALLDALAGADAERPRALVARARLAQARGVSDVAERLAEEARRRGGDCAALDLLDEIARSRDAVAREDELAGALATCPRGRERTVDHRRRRGDLGGALAAASEVVRFAPARVDARLVRADLLLARGDARAAADDLAALARLWPRDPRVEKRRAEALDAAGDRAGARAARERALLLDGADLRLRRAVALEDGKEPLDDLAEDGAAALAAFRAAPPAPGIAGATVLDFAAIEAHPDGAYTERVHVIAEAKDQRAVDKLGEVSVPAGAELLAARTVKRDGRALEAESPTGEKRTLSLPGLEPGDFAEWEFLRAVPSRGPAVPGFSADPFFFRADTPLWRSSYVVSAPRGTGLAVDARRLAPPPVHAEGDREVVRVLAEKVPAVAAEPHAPPESEFLPFVQVGAGAGDLELARALGDALADAFRPSLEVRAVAQEILASVPAGARATDALPRAAYRRVAELVVGAGGSFTEGAGAVLSRGRGSRTVLLKSVLDALGVRARVALVRDFGRDPGAYRFPRPELHDAAVLRVEHGGQVAWVDPSTRGAPYGALPAGLRGADALVLPGPGEELVRARTPDDDARERRQVRLAIAVDARGDATVEGEERYEGYEAAALRTQLERLDVDARRQAVEGSLGRAFRGPALLSLEVEGEKDLEGGPLALRWRARVDGWARLEEGRAVAEAPLFPARLGARFVQRAAREFPLLVAATERASLEVAVALPPGWRAAPAPSVEVAGGFGSYRRAERAEVGRLLRSDAYELRRARVSPADYPGFARHAAAVDAAQEVPLVFERTLGDGRPPAPRP